VIIAAGLVAVALAAVAVGFAPRGARSAGALPQSVYLWQRSWTPAVRDAVFQTGQGSDGVVVLAAEVAWRDSRPVIVTPGLDYRALAQTGRPVGLAVRIGPFDGPFAEDDERARMLGDLAARVVGEARAAGCEPGEVQIDFDCATSKLAGYRAWVRAIAAAVGGVGGVAPTPVTITVLPAWLKSAEFEPLVRAAAGFVLQVHALDRPRLGDRSPTLCDTDAARRWVERAARAGVPFRVALPTYGYLVVYGRDGRLAGLVAEGDMPELAEGSTVRELRADAGAMAQLVRTWMADRPELMKGLIWYRMPVAGDRLNWSWVTLASVMRGVAPLARVGVRVREPEPGLVEVVAVNEGEADGALPASITASWSGAEPWALDALGGMEAAEGRGKNEGERSVAFGAPVGAIVPRIGPGEERVVGWIRFTQHVEVRIDVALSAS
jgi:hypothetical protein